MSPWLAAGCVNLVCASATWMWPWLPDYAVGFTSGAVGAYIFASDMYAKPDFIDTSTQRVDGSDKSP